MNVLNTPDPDFMQDEEIVLFSDSVGKWIDEHAPPEKFQQWIANSSVPRQLWNDAGDAGLLGLSLPEEDGGFGGDYRHEVVLMRQLGWKGADHFGISLHNAIVMPLHLALRHGRAEGALAAASAIRRTGRRHRNDRAGRRL